MQLERRTFHLTAWIAMLAILLGALAPAMSHALSQPGNGKRMVQVCTVAGMKMVAVDVRGATADRADPMSDPPADLHAAERCSFCFTHGASPALPSAPIRASVFEGPAADQPPLFFDAPRPLFVWAAARPRAPPLRHA